MLKKKSILAVSRKEARAYYKMGRTLPQGSKESQSCFDLCIQLDGNFSHAYFEKSVPYNKRGDYAKGFKLLNKAVELNPKMHIGYRGWLKLVKLKDYFGCLKDLEELQRISPSKKIAWGENIIYLIGLCYLGIKNYSSASVFFELAIKEKIDNKIDLKHYFYLATALFSLDRFEESIKNLETCLYHNSKLTEVHYYLGLNFYKLNEYQKSLSYLNKSMILIKEGFKNQNPYNEVTLELYESDILLMIDKLEER